MSNRDLTFVRRSALKSVARLVAYALADHCNEATGKCCPSVGRLVASTGLCERAVRKKLRELEEMGVMTASPLHKNGWEVRHYVLKFKLLPVGKYWTDRETNLGPPTDGRDDMPVTTPAGGTTYPGGEHHMPEGCPATIIIALGDN